MVRKLMVITNHITTNVLLKLFSIFLGYALWILIGQYHIIEQSFSIPICLYDVNDQYEVRQSEQAGIVLQASRAFFAHFAIRDLAIHIDGTMLQPGKNRVIINREHLFLPEQVKLIHLSPVCLHIDLLEKTKSD